MRKKNDPTTPIHLFLTRSAGSGKTFVAKAIYHGLLHFYNKDLHSDPLKKKGIIVAFTRKAVYNVNGITVHSTLLLPLNSTNRLPSSSNPLDLLDQ